MKSGALGLALLCVAALAVRVPDATALPRAARADSLCRSAIARAASGRHEQRTYALREMEDAVLLAPDSTRYWIVFGRLNLESGRAGKARNCYEHALRRDPRSGAAELGLGHVWKRDWLQLMDRRSFDAALLHLRRAVALDSTLGEAWLTLGPLLFERGDVSGALAAAGHARAALPRRAEPLIAAASAEYQLGHVERAFALFGEAIPRLPRALRAHFDDVTPLIGNDAADVLEYDSPAVQAEYRRRFWNQADPDPTTPMNEARVQYWARVAHATLLLSDPGETRWDLRAELYVRYGSPGAVLYDRVGGPNQAPVGKGVPFVGYDRTGRPHAIGEPMWYPLHAEDWVYPDLGMSILLIDPSLNYDYQLPRRKYASNDPVPDPRALMRSDLIATAGGRGVFRTLPPGAHALEVRGAVTRFEGARGTRLLAQLEAPGSPVDSLWAQCVVTDSTEHVVARAERELSPSGCDPATVRAGDFSFDVPPGVYRLAFVVRDGRNGRGLARASSPVDAPARGLAMSDVVVTCGPLDPATMRDAIRLGPNLRSQVRGDEPLIAYFEVYRLTPADDGHARFEYEYSVEPVDSRPWIARVLGLGRETHYSVNTQEENVGPLRRQFITVPVATLKPGPYRLVVRVKDVRTGASTVGTARFERVGEGAAGEAGSH
jgi:GWxTD domain-containing protein